MKGENDGYFNDSYKFYGRTFRIYYILYLGVF